MARDYKQYNYNATYSGGSFASQACGPTSCADIVEVSPLTTANWLTQHGYSTVGHGTEWDGIAPCLSAFGGGGIQLNSGSLLGQTSNSVFNAWQKHIQSGYMGILLMGAGVNTYWTTSGHFIAIVEYRNGQYLVYDPASATRTGWYGFGSFAGNIKICYTSSVRWDGGSGITDYSFTPAKIQMGSNNRSVLLAQKILYTRGLYPRKAGFDGSFGEQTDKAVRAYQKFCKLDIDGIVGDKTWESMLGIAGTPKVVKGVQMGDKSVYVFLLQELLNADGFYMGSFDWKFGEGTYAGVRNFQKANGLEVDGVCGENTWKRLIRI